MASQKLNIHMLDVGEQEYGDAVLLELGDRTVLIDGGHRGDDKLHLGHPSIPQQLQTLTGQAKPRIDLLVVSHAHLDHIGCLPELIADDTVDVVTAFVSDPDLAWGIAIDGPPPDFADQRVAAAMAGLREEPRSAPLSDAGMEGWLADAAGLRDRYIAMLDTLRARNTRVILQGRDDPQRALASLGPVKIELLGPSQVQLEACSAGIGRAVDDALIEADRILSQDASVAAPSLYSALMRSSSADAEGDRPGALINLQSISLSLTAGNRRLLLAGDMQFASPGTADMAIRTELALLRDRIRSHKGYAFAKLSHHGSPNAFDNEVMNDLGTTRLFGISAGASSEKHPSKSVLDALAGRTSNVWVRTDRNGLSSIRRNGSKWEVITARGTVNDRSVNAPDQVTKPGVAQPPASQVPSPASGAISAKAEETRLAVEDRLEVVIRIPRGVPRVSLDISIPAEQQTPRVDMLPAEPPATAALPTLNIGGGRALPPLLYVTDGPRLEANIGLAEARHCLERIEARAGVLLDLAGAGDASASERLVHAALELHPEIEGIVLVGGYDVVPSRRLDTVPATLANRVQRGKDADRFWIWTDDGYARPPATTTIYPISRIPDGRSAAQLYSALSASSGGGTASGVRNSARPFAEDVYGILVGGKPLFVSEPTAATDVGRLSSDLVYLMLHGNYSDATKMWGELRGGASLEAFNIAAVGDVPGSVVFTGACWGALTVDSPALSWTAGSPLSQRNAENSIAMASLARGANAFVGCTGSHYSPRDAPYNTMGAPLHRAFWTALLGGQGPARALRDAKVAYMREMPHGISEPTQQAFGHKILWEYTCLGLGW
ncbi:MAG TPA: MBL fold metallo-hydrolase [Galbitalea sp.]|jgi:beta-lactamase superfamily II metal-dependent hydrolase